MKRDLKPVSTQDLVARFTALSIDQDDAVIIGDTRRYNRLFREYTAIEDELKSREGDQRHALRPLFDHTNPQVRMNAAFSTLAILPEEAKATLQLIKDRREYPQAGDAWGMLNDIASGKYIPDVGRVDML